MKTLVVGIFLSSQIAFAATSETFSVPSKDQATTLHGQIDYPDERSSNLPLVVMVPGSGLFTRDEEFGRSGTDEDLVFRVISNALTQKGLAVLRYDYRGVSCSMRTMPPCPTCTTQQERFTHYVNSCLDNKIRAGVTPENIRDDIETVTHHGLSSSRIDKARLVLFGHSEGSAHISQLVGDKRLNPHAIAFMTGFASSPASIIRWQSVDRMVQFTLELDSNRDGSITNDEIKEGAPKHSFLKLYPVETLLSPTGAWTRESLTLHFRSAFDSANATILAQDDMTPYEQNGAVVASFRWWKMFVSDDIPALSHLANFNGPIVYHFGSIDSQVTPSLQLHQIDELRSSLAGKAEVILHENKGHGLGADPLFGPISKAPLESLVNSILRVSGAAN